MTDALIARKKNALRRIENDAQESFINRHVLDWKNLPCYTVHCFQLVYFSQPEYCDVGNLATGFSHLEVFSVDRFQ